MPENKQKLACDFAVISDSSQFAPGQPAITYGLKGLAYFELLVQGANRDLHSGTYGGAVANPLNALATILASLKGPDGKIQIAGFYDAVKPLEDWERAEFAKLAFSEAEFQADLGVPALEGEAGYTTLERKWARPTCDINGIFGGYAGPGPKTVLPCKGGAKLSFRLVPDQDPKTVERQFKEHVAKVCPPGVTYEIISHHGAPAVLVNIDTPGVKAAVRAIEASFGTRPVFIREGGSIPVVGLIKQHLGVDTLLLGWGQNDDNLHGPNEKFSLADFHRGIKAQLRHLLDETGWRRSRSQGVLMLDLKFVVANAEAVKQNCRNRNVPADVLEDVDRVVGARRPSAGACSRPSRRSAAARTRSPRPPAASAIPRSGRRLIEEGKRLKSSVAEEEERLRRLEAEMTQRLRRIPNLTHPDAPVGLTEDESRELRKVGTPRAFDFKPKDHVELGKALDLIDFETAGKVSGTGFYFLKNDAVLLDLALQQFALRKLIDAGFTPIITPDLARNQYPGGDRVHAARGRDAGLFGRRHRPQPDRHRRDHAGRNARRRDPRRGRLAGASTSGCRIASGPRPAPPAGPAAGFTAFTSSPRSRCSRSARRNPRARCTPRCWRSRKTCSSRWAFPTACSTSARATWAGRPIASSISKPGCPAAASTANTAR